jgi:hypothetical protein
MCVFTCVLAGRKECDVRVYIRACSQEERDQYCDKKE